MGQLAKSPTRDHGNGTSKTNGHNASGSVADRAKSLLGDGLAERQNKSASAISDAAEALRLSSHSLGGNMLVPYVEKVADQLKRVATFVENASPSEIGKNIEQFARKEPLLFLGGAAVLGLLGGRFMRASAETVASVAGAAVSTSSGSTATSKKRPVAQA